MDRAYKEDIPARVRDLEHLYEEFAALPSKTDWNSLRIEPLLEHARTLHRLLRSPAFSRESSRLRTGVVMFHSDLVYLRENVRALKAILAAEKRPRAAKRAPSRIQRTTRRAKQRAT